MVRLAGSGAADEVLQAFRVDGLETVADFVGGVDGALGPVFEASVSAVRFAGERRAQANDGELIADNVIDDDLHFADGLLSDQALTTANQIEDESVDEAHGGGGDGGCLPSQVGSMKTGAMKKSIGTAKMTTMPTPLRTSSKWRRIAFNPVPASQTRGNDGPIVVGLAVLSIRKRTGLRVSLIQRWQNLSEAFEFELA